jgi:hypothetical protein
MGTSKVLSFAAGLCTSLQHMKALPHLLTSALYQCAVNCMRALELHAYKIAASAGC